MCMFSTSLNLSFLVCKMGVVILFHTAGVRTETVHLKHLVQSSNGSPVSLLLPESCSLTADGGITYWLPRIPLFSQTPFCGVENSSCLIRRRDNRKPHPTLLSSLTSNSPSHLDPSLRSLIICCRIWLLNLLAC